MKNGYVIIDGVEYELVPRKTAITEEMVNFFVDRELRYQQPDDHCKKQVLSFDDIISCTYPYVTFNFNKEGKDYKILDEEKLRELVEKRINK